MIPGRQGLRGLLATLCLALLWLILAACTGGSILTKVSLSLTTISPNGDGMDDALHLDYALSRDATVSITFLDAQGKRYPFRTNEARSAGSYSARFNGTYAPDEAQAKRQVLANGVYTALVQAQDKRGQTDEWRSTINIVDADTTAPQVTDLVVLPSAISPNGDAIDDEAKISYGLSKPATVEIFVTDAQGSRYPLEGANPKSAALHAHNWNGTSGGELLFDGQYVLHVQALDKAGNLTDQIQPVIVSSGGIPSLELTKVKFAPLSVPTGGVLNVEIQVKNVGSAILRTYGPDPGTPYTTNMTFNSFRDKNKPDEPPLYYERAGYWRVGVSWGLAGQPYPVRWGFGKDLAPGEEATITGTIQVLIDQTREVYFWASAVQEGVGFPGGQVGQQRIIISY